MIFRFTLQRGELGNLLLAAGLGCNIGLVRPKRFYDKTIGMAIEPPETNTYLVEMDGMPGDFIKAIEKIDPKSGAPHPPGWFK